MSKDGGPAFPGGPFDEERKTYPAGMFLRAWLTGMIVAELAGVAVADPDARQNMRDLDSESAGSAAKAFGSIVAAVAIEIADATIEALEEDQ